MQPSDSFINDLEQLQGPLEDADRDDIETYLRGQELRGIVTTPAWDIILASLQSYADQATLDLLKIPPGDERVMAAHAAASAAAQININFKMDVQSAIDAASQLPEILKRGLKNDFNDVSRGDGQS